MKTDMVSKLIDLSLGANQKHAQYAVMRAQKHMREEVLKAAEAQKPQPAPPPPGQGTRLDRSV